MEHLDTGKYSLSKVGDRYVHVIMYADQELTIEEVPTVTAYFRQFQGRVPVLVDRQGRYALSAGAQIAFIKHAKDLFSALGFLDHTPLQRKITQIAGMTYLRGLPIRSFAEIRQAEAWLQRYGPLPPFKAV